jgi:hypothetical protein
MPASCNLHCLEITRLPQHHVSLEDLWHDQVRRTLDLIGEAVVIMDATADHTAAIAAAARKVVRLLGEPETYVSGQSDIIIDYATTRRCEEPIWTAIVEGTAQWLAHRRMNARQQMRWPPRAAHLMLKVRTPAANGTLERDHAEAEFWACRPFRRTAESPPGLGRSLCVPKPGSLSLISNSL